MTEAEQTFLAEVSVGRVATVDAQGFPHITPVRLSWNGEYLEFETDGGSQKMANLRRNPRMAILIDGEKKRGLLLQGTAEIARDAAGKDQALVRLRPERVRSWRLNPPG
jgi:nitroimidazol reductase NimA-like FMN-containing flavoprotein (pyridoxamine 5'-phosphate oxidase superfamily)